MADPSSFVNIVDRYLEVSNVYHLRMDSDVLAEDDASQSGRKRLQKLASKIEQAVKAAKKPTPVKVVQDGQELGQIVTTNQEFLDNTKRRQEDVLERIKKIPGWVQQPTNMRLAEQLLELEPQEFLGSFPSLSYASDVLSELASWTVCPDVTLLAARDMIHMHAVELQRNLIRVITQVKLISADQTFEAISLTVQQLREIQNLESLEMRKVRIEELVENSVPRNPVQLFEELAPMLKNPPVIGEWLTARSDDIMQLLSDETHFFRDALENSGAFSVTDRFTEARKICNSIVVYGLASTYAAWYSCALTDPKEMGSFRTNILFCTRILLNEKRWEVCREFAQLALEAMKKLNEGGDAANNRGAGMLTANLFFARIKSGEKLADIKSEIEDWDVEAIHPRYRFLKLILLEDFDAAGEIAIELLGHCKDTGIPNMCVQEFNEWPILESFRASSAGKSCLTLSFNS